MQLAAADNMLKPALLLALCCLASSYNVSLKEISFPLDTTSVKVVGQVNGHIWVSEQARVYSLLEASQQPSWHQFWTLSFGSVTVGSVYGFQVTSNGELTMFNENSQSNSTIPSNVGRVDTLITNDDYIFAVADAVILVYGTNESPLPLLSNLSLQDKFKGMTVSTDDTIVCLSTSNTTSNILIYRHLGHASWTMSVVPLSFLDPKLRIVGWISPTVVVMHASNAGLMLVDTNPSTNTTVQPSTYLPDTTDVLLALPPTFVISYMFNSRCLQAHAHINGSLWAPFGQLCFDKPIRQAVLVNETLLVNTGTGVATVDADVVRRLPALELSSTSLPPLPGTTTIPEASPESPDPTTTTSSSGSPVVSPTAMTPSSSTPVAPNASSTSVPSSTTSVRLAPVAANLAALIAGVGAGLLLLLSIIAVLLYRYVARRWQTHALLTNAGVYEAADEEDKLELGHLPTSKQAPTPVAWETLKVEIAERTSLRSSSLQAVLENNQIDQLDDCNRSLVAYSCICDRPAAAKELAALSSIDTMNQLDVADRAPIHWACLVGSIDCLEALLGPNESRISILYLETSTRQTVLHLAASEGNADVLEKLLQVGSRVLRFKLLYSDGNGETALDVAIRKGHTLCQRILEEEIAHIRHQGESDQFLKYRLANAFSMRRQRERLHEDSEGRKTSGNAKNSLRGGKKKNGNPVGKLRPIPTRQQWRRASKSESGFGLHTQH
eukprot:m.177428 g.177428  ORF g.177428 m.177428 type:complete len:723 (+) comp16819_c0_seq8:301-2469(+)